MKEINNYLSIKKRHEASLHLLNLINELAQLRLDFNKKLKQICKRHYLKSNKQSDTCFNAYKALLDFIHYTRNSELFFKFYWLLDKFTDFRTKKKQAQIKSEYIEQAAKQVTTELNKIGFEKCLQQLTKQKDKIVDNLRRDEQGLAEAKKTLQKVSF